MKNSIKIGIIGLCLFLTLLLMTDCMSETLAPPTKSAANTTTIRPTFTLTYTAPPTNIETMTPSPTHTITPISTISTEQVKQAFFEYIETLENCKLPCWLGIVPGETQWSDAENVFHSFQAKFDRYYSRRLETFEVRFLSDKSSGYSIFGGQYFLKNGIVEVTKVISISQYPNATNYSLASILDQYGVPSRVWLDVSPSQPQFLESPFSIYLFYEDQGFVVGFHSEGDYLAKKTFAEPSMIEGCFREKDIPSVIAIWNLDRENNISEYKSFVGWEEGKYLSIEAAAGLSITEFYNSFTDPSTAQYCIQTPTETWNNLYEP